MFKVGTILKSTFILGLSIFSGYLVFTGKPEAGLAGVGSVITIVTMKDDDSEEKIQKLQEEYQNERLRNLEEQKNLEIKFLKEQKNLEIKSLKETNEIRFDAMLREEQLKRELAKYEVLTSNNQIPLLPQVDTSQNSEQTSTFNIDNESDIEPY